MCILAIFVVASASASDLNETTVLESDEEAADVDVSSCSDNDFDVESEKLGEVEIQNTPFSNLSSLIQNTNNGSVLELDSDYFNDGSISGAGISVTNSITIDGKGHTLDAKGKSRIFAIKANNVVLKNIVFKNGLYGSGNGGAVYWSGSNCLVVNCTFMNNKANGNDAGALSFSSCVNCSVLNSTFVKNSAGMGGGAIYFGFSTNCYVSDCNLINSSTTYDGGAIIIWECKASSINNCTFFNSYAGRDGGAVFWYRSNNVVISNSSFVKNSARSRGGAIDHHSGSNGLISNCSFDGNSAGSSGRAIYVGSGSSSVVNSTFVNHNSNSFSGSLNFLDCIFNDVYPSGNYHYTSYLDVNDFIVFEGNDKFLVARLYDIRGAVPNKSITFNIAGINYNAVTDEEGFAKLNITNIVNDFGSFTTFVMFEGDSVNNPVSKSVLISSRSNTVLNVNDLSVFIGENGFLVANLSDDDGPLSSKIITISVNDKAYNVTTDSNGLARFNIKNLLNESGRYDVKVIYGGDESTNPASAISHVVIMKYDSILDVNGLNVKVDESGTLIAHLYDSRRQLANRNITFTINGRTYVIATDEYGFARLDIADMRYGSYDVTVNFAGDDYNNPVATSSQVIVNRYDSILEVNDASIVLGDNCVLIANLSNVYGSLVGREVTFNIDEVSYRYVTDSNGSVRFDRNIFTEYGTFVIRVDFAGDEFNSPASVNADVHVNKNIYNLTVSQVGIYYGDTNLTFKLVDSRTNENIPDVPVSIVFSNGVIYDAVTNSRGEFIYEVPFLPGNYEFTSTVNVPDIGINRIGFSDFEISKLMGRINIVQGSDCRILNFELTNLNTGEAFNNYKIALSFEPNGEKVNVTTDDEGKVSYNMTFGSGTYSVVASVIGEYVEVSSVRLDNIEINDYPNSEIHIGDSFEFDFLETGMIGSYVDGGSIIRENIYVDGHPEAIIDINNAGVISISNLSAGRYTLRLKSTPLPRYNSVTRSILINVKKVDCGVSVSNFTFNYGETGFTAVSIDGGSVGNISVVGHPEADIKFKDDKIYVSNLTVGNYDLIFSTIPDGNHNSVTSNVRFAVNKTDCLIDMRSISFVYKDTGSTSVAVVGGSIGNISVFNHPEAVIEFNGENIRVSNLTVGIYDLIVSAIPDGNHNPVVRKESVTVSEKESSFEFPNIVQPYFGGSGYFIVKVEGGEISKENISVANHTEAIIDLEGNMITVSNLTVGKYALLLKSTPYENYKSVTESKEIIVNKVDSRIFFSPPNPVIEFNYLESGSIHITVDGGTVIYDNIKMPGHPEVDIAFDGENIRVSNLAVGTHTLYITTIPDENHNSYTQPVNVIVNKIDSKVDFTNEIVFDEGGNGSTNISVVGGSQGDVYVVNHTEAIINITGNSITVSNLTAGNYTLCVSTYPDRDHNSVDGLIGITVNKVPTGISFTNEIVFDYGGVGSTTVEVLGGFVLSSDIIVVGQSDAEININNKNFITVWNLTAGSYVLEVKTTPDSQHRSGVGRVNITVNRVPSKISCDDIIFDYDKISLTTVNVEGGVLNVSDVKIDGYPNAISASGNSISISGLNAGNYSLHLSSIPDKNHYSGEATVDVIVNKVKSSVRLSSNITFDYQGISSTFVIIDGGSLSSDNICIINHTEANIKFENNVIYVSGLNAGEYILSVMTTPDENHYSVNGSVSVSVNKINSQIKSYSPIVFNYLKSGSTFVTVDGGRLSNAKMEVVGHREAYISYGNNQISVSNLNPGTYSLRVESIPDANHNADVKYISVTVNKAPVRTEAKSKTVALKKGSWTVRVLDSNNNPVSNIQVILKVYTGKKFSTVKVMTNARGEATYSTKGLSKGTHKVIASIEHAGYYANPVTSSIKVIKQTKLNFNVKKNVAKDGSSLSITVKQGKKGINGVGIKLFVYTGKKLTKTVTLKSKKKGKYNGACGWGTNKLTAGNHKIVIKPSKLKFSGSKTVNLKITKSALKNPKWETKI